MFKKGNGNQDGMTILEMIITTSIVLIVTAVGTPQYLSSMSKKRVDIAANEFIAAFNLARAKAAALDGGVIICIRSGDHCSSSKTSWAEGWYVFKDENDNNQIDVGDSIFEEHKGYAEFVKTFSVGAVAMPRAVEFNELGNSSVTGKATLNFCAIDGRTNYIVRVAMTRIGRGAKTTDDSNQGCASKN